MVVAVRQAGLDHEVPLLAALPHPAEVAVADPLGAGPVLGTGPVQAVSCRRRIIYQSSDPRDQFEVVGNNLAGQTVG